MRINLPTLVSILRKQSLYIALAAVIGAVFWAIGMPINLLTVLLYSLSIGNLIVPVTERLEPIYAHRPFPYNWLLFLLILLVDCAACLSHINSNRLVPGALTHSRSRT